MRKDTPYKNNSKEDLPTMIAKMRTKIIEEILTVFALKKIRGVELIEPIKFPKKYKTDFVIETLANTVVELILGKTEWDTEAKNFENIIIDETRSMIATKILPIMKEENVFFQIGHNWVVQYKGKPTTLRDRKGLQYIGYLLKHPREEFGVFELTSVIEKNQPAPIAEENRGFKDNKLGELGIRVRKGSYGGRMKPDQRAIFEYKRKIKDLECERDEAQRFNDQGGVERINNEILQLYREIQTDIDNPAIKKAYLNIKNHISRALKDIGNDPNISPLKKYLQRYIKTGFSCSYNPDPDHTISWHIFTNA